MLKRFPRWYGVWLGIALFVSAQNMLVRVSRGSPIELQWDLFHELVYWSIWALFAQAIVRLVRRDVQIPGFDGFEVIEQVGGDAMPLVIFVTAYDTHALRAFETHAVDYLLKPIDPDRFRTALERAETRIAGTRLVTGVGSKLAALLDSVGPEAPLEQIAVKHEGRISFVKVDAIDWIEATGTYVTLHVGATALSCVTPSSGWRDVSGADASFASDATPS